MERWANTVKTICFKLFQKWAIKPGGNPIPKHQCPTLCYFHLHKQNLSFRASLNENGQQHRHQFLPNKRGSCLCYFPPKRFFSQNISYHILCFQKAPERCTLAVQQHSHSASKPPDATTIPLSLWDKVLKGHLPEVLHTDSIHQSWGGGICWNQMNILLGKYIRLRPQTGKSSVFVFLSLFLSGVLYSGSKYVFPKVKYRHCNVSLKDSSWPSL